MTVTIRDVAREARVSVASVSRALNGHVNVTDSTRRRIAGVAARLRYVPHGAARSLITRRTQTIGALLPQLYGEFFSELIRGIDLAARARGLHLIVSSSHGNADEAAAVLRSMQGRVDGMLILSPHVDAAFLRANLASGIPAILLNSAVRSAEYPALNIDNIGGAGAIVRHFLEMGYRNVALIAGPADNFDARQREKGYRTAMAKSAPRVRLAIVDGDFGEESGYRAAHKLLARKPRPRAVFAANDMMAIGALSAFKQAGVRVPEDIALAGFDDIPIAAYVTPALTTVRTRISDLGRAALERLVARLAKPSAPQPMQTLACEIVVRRTCGVRATAEKDKQTGLPIQ